MMLDVMKANGPDAFVSKVARNRKGIHRHHILYPGRILRVGGCDEDPLRCRIRAACRHRRRGSRRLRQLLLLYIKDKHRILTPPLQRHIVEREAEITVAALRLRVLHLHVNAFEPVHILRKATARYHYIHRFPAGTTRRTLGVPTLNIPFSVFLP